MRTTAGAARARARPSTRRGLATILLATVLAASGLSVAHAYFSGGGTGLGTASVGTVAPVTVSPAVLVDQLYPGGSVDVAVTVHNPNTTDVLLQSLVLDTSRGTNGFARASGSASCTLGSFSFVAQDNDGDGWVVGGGDSIVIALPSAVVASVSTPSACQGAVLTVYLKAA